MNYRPPFWSYRRPLCFDRAFSSKITSRINQWLIKSLEKNRSHQIESCPHFLKTLFLGKINSIFLSPLRFVVGTFNRSTAWNQRSYPLGRLFSLLPTPTRQKETTWEESYNLFYAGNRQRQHLFIRAHVDDLFSYGARSASMSGLVNRNLFIRCTSAKYVYIRHYIHLYIYCIYINSIHVRWTVKTNRIIQQKRKRSRKKR